MPQTESKITLETSKKDVSAIRDQNEDGVPQYLDKLTLTEDQKQAIVDDIFAELKAIQEERDDAKLEDKWRALDNQYDGKVTPNEDQQFNLNVNSTKVKVDGVVRLITKAFMRSDPRYSITSRPGEGDGGSVTPEVCDKQSDFLDYKMDMVIPFHDPEALTIHSATLKGTGILNIEHVLERKPRRREEYYEGKMSPIYDRDGREVGQEARGLKEFLEAYPDAETKYPQYVKQLASGRSVCIVVKYDETTYDDPLPRNVDLYDFYVRKNTEGYEGLKSATLIAERRNFTWRELKAMERKGDLENVDSLIPEQNSNKSPDNNSVKNYKYATYDLLRCIYMWQKEEDSDPEKIVVWLAEKQKIFMGAIRYPYYTIDCPYVPHYIKKKVKGFYQPGIAEDITDNNVAENALMNFMLEGAWIANMVTPIVDENSSILDQFASKTWVHGLPLVKRPNESAPDFLNRYMKPFSINEMERLLLHLKRNDDDVTGHTSLMTGQESPIDPDAPATKTLALLKQSGINVEDYIYFLLPAFNTIGQILLQMYFQISQTSVSYVKISAMASGGDPFGQITRAEMMAKTKIQAQAANFNFDEMNEKRENVALYSIVRQEPLVASNPQAVYFLLKHIIKSWSGKWRKEVDKILPNPEILQQAQTRAALQGVGQYFKAVMAQAQATGQAPAVNPEILVQTVAKLQAALVNPQDPEQAKETANAASQSV